MKLTLLALLTCCCLTGCVGLVVQHPISTRAETQGMEAVQKARRRVALDKCPRIDDSKGDREIYECDEGVGVMWAFLGVGILLPIPYFGRDRVNIYEIGADTVAQRSKEIGAFGAMCGLYWFKSDPSVACGVAYRDKQYTIPKELNP
jgi:hypothetical protein